MFQILTFYGVDTEVISQIFRQIYYFLCAFSLNNLLLRKELCHWSKGFQIRHNLSHFEMWTREKQLDVNRHHCSFSLFDIFNSPLLLLGKLYSSNITADNPSRTFATSEKNRRGRHECLRNVQRTYATANL